MVTTTRKEILGLYETIFILDDHEGLGFGNIISTKKNNRRLTFIHAILI